jgi:plastocyanin
VYLWLVFAHLVGVFGFLAAHGISMSASFRLRKERDPARVNDILEASASSSRWMYVFLVLLLLGGAGAAFQAHLWSQSWIWIATGIFVVVTVFMQAVGSPYYRKVRLIARAMSDGSRAVTGEQFDEVLRSPRPNVVMVVGVLGLGAILYLMLFKPTFSSASVTPPPAASAPAGPVIRETAQQLTFGSARLSAPSGTGFRIAFDNQAPGIKHNIAVDADSSAEKPFFVGEIVTGPTTITYRVAALPAGSYFFRCDVHPQQMTGTLVVR